MIIELIVILAALVLLAVIILLGVEKGVGKQNEKLFKNMQECDILKPEDLDKTRI
tara:strand:- start:17015 stop:17179 length:165 start_codon:yes stop_codon:yes gene_type:complete